MILNTKVYIVLPAFDSEQSHFRTLVLWKIYTWISFTLSTFPSLLSNFHLCVMYTNTDRQKLSLDPISIFSSHNISLLTFTTKLLERVFYT